MYKIEVNNNEILNEKTYVTTLYNGLKVYICKKNNYKKKIAMFGTKYGSTTNDFVDIYTNERVKVPDGIAHFLEHKLFEKPDQNSLDKFSSIGASANAYTSYDQTVYYVEAIEKFERCIEILVELIKKPYFTDENVQKEQGIIAQEISMYDADPTAIVFENLNKAMYNKNNVRIDIAGTVDSISNINKELLYTCHKTFYNPENMFFVVVGDVEVEDTIKLIEDNIKKYELDEEIHKNVEKFYEDEKEFINKEIITQKMDIFMPIICVGYKLNVVNDKEIIKRAIVSDIISDMYFSKISNFYKKEYDLGIISDTITFSYEGTDTFSHVVLAAESTNIDKLKEDLFDYIKEIKNSQIDEELFNIVKNKKIGSIIRYSDEMNTSYKRIIDSIITGVDIYCDIDILNSVTSKDIQDFINLLDDNKRSISLVVPNK